MSWLDKFLLVFDKIKNKKTMDKLSEYTPIHQKAVNERRKKKKNPPPSPPPEKKIPSSLCRLRRGTG